MKSLLKYLKDYKKEVVCAPLFKLLEVCFELFVPLVMAGIIDKGIANEDKSYILKMCLLLVVLGIVGLISAVSAQFFAAKAAVGFATKLRHALFSHIQSLSYAEQDKLGTATMITRMTSDINQTQNGVNMTLRLLLRSPVVVFGAMIMAFTVDVKAAVIFVVIIPLLSIVVYTIMHITIPMYRKTQSGLDKVLLLTRENLAGARVIRAFNREEDEICQFQTENNQLTNMQLKVGKISALMNPLTYVLINFSVIALIYVGAIRVDTGHLTQGEVIALVNYMSQILVELVKLANLIITVTKSLACAKRIEGIFQMESSQEETKNPISIPSRAQLREKNIPLFHFDHVSFTYPGAKESAVEDVDFKVYEGQTIGIIGGTGCGKSTIIKLLPRYYDATKGTVYFCGNDIRNYRMDDVRSQVGMVMQKAVLFKGTIRSNLLWGKKDATDEEIYQALELAQAKEVVEGKEHKLDEVVEQGGKNFSGGQKQRLTIARALVRKPRILVLDDSASALDFATDARLRQALKTIKDQTTTFIVSQRTSSIMHADQILVLDDGKVTDIGTHEELMKRCETYREIHYTQIPKEEQEKQGEQEKKGEQEGHSDEK